MPTKNISAGRLAVLAALCGAMLSAASLEAQDRRSGRTESRFSISAGGGMGRTDERQGMMELKLGFQYRLAAPLRIGLGFGYMKSERHHGMDRRDGRSPWMGGAEWGGRIDGESPDFRVRSVTLDLAYALPVGRKWDITIGGGAGRYFGEFPGGIEDVRRRAWGGQGGLGAELRISTKLTAFAEAGYRFLEFRDIPVPSPIVPLMGVDERLRPIADWVSRGLAMWMPQLAPRPVDVRLDGPSLRMGLRFGL